MQVDLTDGYKTVVGRSVGRLVSYSSSHACCSTRSCRLSNTNLLSAPFVCTLFVICSFIVEASNIWNS